MILNAVNRLPKYTEEIIAPMLSLYPKLVLTGSNVLYMFDIIKKAPGDIDISYTSMLSQEELCHIKDFFNLEFIPNPSNYPSDIRDRFTPKNFLEKDMIQLITTHPTINTKIDIFNREVVLPRDVIMVNYFNECMLKVCHPSIAIGYKARYAFDARTSTSYKHLQDLKDLIINSQTYYKHFGKT